MAQAYEAAARSGGAGRREGGAGREREKSCFTCKMKNKCVEFRARSTGGSNGVVSFGGDETFVCDRYVPAAQETKTMSAREIKSLLKNVKRGHV